MSDGLPLKSFVRSEYLHSRFFIISSNGVLDEGGGGLFKHTSVGVWDLRPFCQLGVSMHTGWRPMIFGGIHDL